MRHWDWASIAIRLDFMYLCWLTEPKVKVINLPSLIPPDPYSQIWAFYTPLEKLGASTLELLYERSSF
jgi:hypothetical protein